jgi:hypothetical protein
MKKIAGLIGFAILLACYWHGAQEQARRVNVNPLAVDQRDYLDMAAKMKMSDYSVLTSRSKMPAMSFLVSLLYRPGMTGDDLFARAKQMNIVLSLGALALIFFILRGALSLPSAVNVILIAAFTVFVFKAPFVQCEVLFYALNFALFVLMLKMLRRPSWHLALMTGAIAALAYLSKSSMLIGFVLFGGCWLLKHGRVLRNIGLLAATAALFLAILAPYLHNSKRFFGSYFYNSNSAHIMWHESWEEARVPSILYDSPAIKNVSPASLPSLGKYFREHTVNQLRARLWYGMKLLVVRSAEAYGYFKYLIIYAMFLLALILCARAEWAVFFNSIRVETFFLTVYFAAYYVAFAWYAAIDFGPRFVLAQFLPLLFVLTYGIEQAQALKPRKWRNISIVALFNAVIVGMLAFDIVAVLRYRIYSMFGGT